MFSTITKTMLKNVIRHTDTHNRIVEETDMWMHLDQVKDRERDPRRSFLYDDRYDMSRDDGRRGARRAHMDDGDNRDDDGKRRSTYWQRQLQKVEEADPDRWGHSGFKEMYPDKFRSDRSEESDDSVNTKKKRKKEKKKRKHKKENGEKKLKSYKNRTKSSSSDESDVDGGERKYNRSSSQSDSHKQTYRSRRSRSSSDSESNSHKRKYKSVTNAGLNEVEPDLSLTHARNRKPEVADFQWVKKPRNVNCENLHSRDKSGKYFKDDCERGLFLKSNHVMTTDKHYSSRSCGDGKDERKSRDQSHDDKVNGKKRKHGDKSHRDDDEGSRKKKRHSTSDSSKHPQDSVHDSQNSDKDEKRSKKSKKYENKHKSKKKHKHSAAHSDESSESDSDRHYRKR
ncbi:uncharacterized protein NKAPD1-like [Gigantopelta aegis]|uniref:uncharacterized protein NKAPD1-like n=1 Tax=Gigantopelta aegis TaxID=1735272 RepID=UPI001B88BEBA|nr:uncharacterized protein NKAPD1-like [Gigantopelta aegis]